MTSPNKTKTVDISAEGFWHFSCEEYAQNKYYSKGKQSFNLLELQNKFGKNVNICLLMLYLDKFQIKSNQEVLLKLIQTITHFDTTYLLPLRVLRKKLKSQYDDIELYKSIRSKLLDAELLMEKHQQSQLIVTLKNYSLTHNDLVDNLSFYLNFNEKLI
jgi:uncharacterized protein (TIGR02444 family)